MCPFGEKDGPAIFSGAPDWWDCRFAAYGPVQANRVHARPHAGTL